MRFGLLGGKLGHSYSPQIHTMLAGYSYTLFEKQPDELEAFFTASDFKGINVTAPYKKTVIPYCASLSDTAQKLGAVNTILRRDDGSFIGHNTDYYGFSSMLQRFGIPVKGKKCLVLGSGGASATAVCVLKEAGAQVTVISRSADDNYTNLHRHKDAALIVNATPVGMYPHVGISPVDLSIFTHLEGVLDLIYNPARTQLLLDAENSGIPTMNGLWMLVAQAKESAEWFLGHSIDDSMIETVYRKLKLQMENIVLIGMPGSGKSTVGALLAQKMGKTFVDADEQIEIAANKKIPEIFRDDGEDGFRKRETQVLSELGKASGLVIATGGGCVTREENYPLLHQNGTILWLARDVRMLPTEGRPLSQANNLDDMLRKRKPLYQRFADICVDNNGDTEQTLTAICRIMEDTV